MDFRTRVLLSVQRALLGEISPEMRAVAVEISPGDVRLRVYWDGPVRPEAIDDFDASAVTQVVAEFPHPERGDPTISFEFERVDEPEPILPRGVMVYARQGVSTRAV